MVSIKLENVSKVFGQVKALDGVNLDIADGEFVVFLGPSGGGKSTLLLIVAGIYKPTTGHVYFDSEDVTDLPPKDRNVGMVFQSYALYPHMTVYDNIAFPLKLKKMPRNEIDRKVRDVAKLMRIDHLLDRRPSQLSGGQQQRVALARALAKEPSVLLLDEPLSNLDALLRINMRAELKRLQRELRVTTIYVTHDQVEAMSMADKIVVINEGRIQQVGGPDEIYGKPANTFVATFIGTLPMNLIPCTLTWEADGGVLVCPGFKYRVPSGIAKNLKGDEVYLGIRPEHVEVVGDGDVKAKVVVFEPLGKDAVITAQIDEHIIKVITKPEVRVSPGDVIGLRLPPEKLFIYDRGTGQLL